MTYNTLKVAVVLAATMAPAVARADDSSVSRSRAIGGLGLGFGEMSADCPGGCDGALESWSVNAHAGMRLGSRYALLVDGWTLGYTEDNATLYHTIVTFGGQMWLSPKMWLRAGVGAAYLSLDDGDEISAESDTVPAVMVAAGYDLYQANSFAVDLQMRSGAGFYSGETDIYSAALTIGVSFGGRPHQAQRLVVSAPVREPAPEPKPVARRKAAPAPAPRPAPEPEPELEVAPQQEVIATVRFPRARAALRRDALRALRQVASELGDDVIRIVVVGHSDATGSQELNAALSRSRASTIRDYLVSHGVDPSRIEVEGRGAEQPLSDNDTEAGRAGNRRAEIIVERRPS